MRLVEVGGGWVVLRPLTVRGYQLFREGEKLLCLALHIHEWSENAPITLSNILRLRDSVVDTLMKELLATVEPVFSMDKDLLRRYVSMFLRNVRAPQDKTYKLLSEKYFWHAQMMLDHKGNIVQLPEGGGWLEQPLDWAIILELYRVEYVKLLASRNKGVRA